MGKETISILGCGWLGLPLGKYLAERGFQLKGSVTKAEKFDLLKASGVLPYHLEVDAEQLWVNDPDFFECDILVISVPPRRIENIRQVYPAQMAQLVPFIVQHKIEKVLFISSTSVYPETLQNATEDSICPPDKESGKAIVLAEDMLKSRTEFDTTILRFGGLIGADRNPARFLMKASASILNTPVNLIHQDDCISIIAAVIDQKVWGETLNACSPEHPLKRDFYGKAAEISGLPKPPVEERPGASKIVNPEKLIRILHYSFKYPSPIDYLNSLGSNKSE